MVVLKEVKKYISRNFCCESDQFNCIVLCLVKLQLFGIWTLTFGTWNIYIKFVIDFVNKSTTFTVLATQSVRLFFLAVHSS